MYCTYLLIFSLLFFSQVPHDAIANQHIYIGNLLTTQTNSLPHLEKHDLKEREIMNFLFAHTIVACLKDKQNKDSKPHNDIKKNKLKFRDKFLVLTNIIHPNRKESSFKSNVPLESRKPECSFDSPLM